MPLRPPIRICLGLVLAFWLKGVCKKDAVCAFLGAMDLSTFGVRNSRVLCFPQVQTLLMILYLGICIYTYFYLYAGVLVALVLGALGFLVNLEASIGRHSSPSLGYCVPVSES